MKLFWRTKYADAFAGGTVATIGNFDGVHLGHQALLAQLKREAKKLNLPLVVMLFEPQPAEFFLGLKAPARLSSLREKIQILRRCEVDYVYCLKFNNKLANTSATDFAKHFCFSVLNARYLLLGADFRFGRGREGDIHLLTQLGMQYECEIGIFPNFIVDHKRVSSTRVREELANANLMEASRLLGRTYSLTGRCVTDTRHSFLDLTTLNIIIKRFSMPVQGVFIVKVKHSSGTWHNGVANVGYQSINNCKVNLLEVHLLDCPAKLPSELLQVYFLKKIRDKREFCSDEEWVGQVQQDIALAKQYFTVNYATEINAIIE